MSFFSLSLGGAVVMALFCAGCAETPAACPPSLVLEHAIDSDAFVKLRSDGPVRFSQVDDRLFRGGQPSAEQLADLKALGVRTVISFRNEDPVAARKERAAAERLGMRFLHFPFSSLDRLRPEFIDRVMAALDDPQNGVVYVHCRVGRDRTSLMVALHLVRHHGWQAGRAWQKAALDYGHVPYLWFRNLSWSFQHGTASSG
jgi:protein tyrosine phosphatase (PTP) superfamily phosphohydrolase (DUF442 family)